MLGLLDAASLPRKNQPQNIKWEPNHVLFLDIPTPQMDQAWSMLTQKWTHLRGRKLHSPLSGI